MPPDDERDEREYESKHYHRCRLQREEVSEDRSPLLVVWWWGQQRPNEGRGVDGLAADHSWEDVNDSVREGADRERDRPFSVPIPDNDGHDEYERDEEEQGVTERAPRGQYG